MSQAIDTRSKELMSRHKAHDPTAMAELYELHERGIKAFVKHRVEDRSLRDDASQSVWLAVLEAAPAYEEEGELFNTWLYSIAARTCRDFEWGAGSERASVAIHVAWGICEASDSEAAFAAEEIREALERALAKVPAEEREAFKLRYAEGFSFVSVGHLIDTDERGARKLVDRCIERLGDALSDKAP